MNHQSKIRKCAVWITAVPLLLTVSLNSQAAQHDAEYYELKKSFGKQWKADDKVVQAKLAKLQKRFGKKPNIIMVLVDDVGYTELGSYGGGKLRGAPTPNLDKMADQGMRFLQFYSEPSCTPSRIALNTGRLPVRVGVLGVLFPGAVNTGLPDEEVTTAELLSDAGYYTGMFGKWHVGFGDEYAPTRHGFDEAVWSDGNPAPWLQADKDLDGSEMVGHVNLRALLRAPRNLGGYYDTGGVMKAKKGEIPQMVYKYSLEKYNTYEEEVFDQSIEFINRNAKSDKPFYLYVGGKANHFFGAHPDFRDTPAQTNTAAQMTETDYNLGRLLKAVKDAGIAENTLVVWASDNGPMYTFHPQGGYSMFDRGEKGETWEGGVRVPAIARWPGMIKEGQDPLDIVQISDWHTTFASIAGAYDKIPNDVVTDGIDQTALLLLGEDKGRRDYVFLYEKNKLEAVRKDWTKFRLKPEKHLASFYNLMHDPAERYPDVALYGGYDAYGITRMLQEHMAMMKKFPNRPNTVYQAQPERPYDPEPTLKYKTKKQVDW
ncbi:MAG: arylsulfatase [Gammaproteobacteria bacterium]|nr:MAG: arylsulfatase [Gammaproteobacteria bacterium]